MLIEVLHIMQFIQYIITPPPILSGSGYCFPSIFFVFFVYSFVSKITRKRLDRFAWNFYCSCGVTMGRPDSILGKFGETVRCRDANFFVSICQHYQQTAGLICKKFLFFREGVEWQRNDLITFLLNSEKPCDAAMRNTGAGFVVLLHHSFLCLKLHNGQ